MKTIIPKGYLSKVSGAVLVIVSSPGLIDAITSINSTFSASAGSSDMPLGLAISSLVASVGVVFGIVRRLWI